VARSASGSAAQAAGAERQQGLAIATRYHRSRVHELRAALVGQPRHELDHASGVAVVTLVLIFCILLLDRSGVFVIPGRE
jgi:hypothetical protein